MLLWKRLSRRNYIWQSDEKRHNPQATKHFDRIPYVIRIKYDFIGLFAYLSNALGGIAYADKKGYIPVVDMKNYMNAYLNDDELGRVNAWEYYFAQPGGISIDDALSCDDYILGRDCKLHIAPLQSAEFCYNKYGELDYWRKICRKYVKFSQPVLDRVNAMREKYQGKRILGVSIRGTDYVSLKPHGHPIQPTPEMVIAKVHEVMREKDFDNIYLATEDKNILVKFQAEFGDKIILPESEYVDFNYNSNIYITMYSTHRENDKYLQGLEYLVAKLFLLECNGLIASMISSTIGIMCLSKGFEYLHVFDLGYYD